jgi:hypothetical protein
MVETAASLQNTMGEWFAQKCRQLQRGRKTTAPIDANSRRRSIPLARCAGGKAPDLRREASTAMAFLRVRRDARQVQREASTGGTSFPSAYRAPFDSKRRFPHA